MDIEPGSLAFKSVSLLGDWVVGSAIWDNPTLSGYCVTINNGAIQTRNCQVDQMTGSAYLFRNSPGVGWSQQQKLVSDELNNAARKDTGESVFTHSNKLGSRRIGSDVRLFESNRLACTGSLGCPNPIYTLAVSCENAYSAAPVRNEVLVYGVSSTGATWSLQQQLFANVTSDLGGGILDPAGFLVNRTAFFANSNDTLIANFMGPLQ